MFYIWVTSLGREEGKPETGLFSLSPGDFQSTQMLGAGRGFCHRTVSTLPAL